DLRLQTYAVSRAARPFPTPLTRARSSLITAARATRAHPHALTQFFLLLLRQNFLQRLIHFSVSFPVFFHHRTQTFAARRRVRRLAHHIHGRPALPGKSFAPLAVLFNQLLNLRLLVIRQII